jgi:hypothetical protein
VTGRGKGSKVGHSLPSTAEVLNKWKHTSSSPACVYVVHTYHFTVTFLFPNLYVCASSVSDVTGYGNFGELRKTKEDIGHCERRRSIFKT